MNDNLYLSYYGLCGKEHNSLLHATEMNTFFPFFRYSVLLAFHRRQVKKALYSYFKCIFVARHRV